MAEPSKRYASLRGPNKHVTCPVCRTPVAIYSTGKIRLHGWYRKASSNPLQMYEAADPCKGSGQIAKLDTVDSSRSNPNEQ